MTSVRVRMPLVLAVLGLVAGCGGSSGTATSTQAKSPAESAAVKAARQALLQSYGLAKDYAATHHGFGDPRTLAPQIGASVGNPPKREPGAIYVAAASGQDLRLVTEALDGTEVTMTASDGSEPLFGVGYACDSSSC